MQIGVSRYKVRKYWIRCQGTYHTQTHTYYSYTSPFTNSVPIYPIKNKPIILIQSSYPTLSNFTLTHTPYREISKYSTFDLCEELPTTSVTSTGTREIGPLYKLTSRTYRITTLHGTRNHVWQSLKHQSRWFLIFWGTFI